MNFINFLKKVKKKIIYFKNKITNHFFYVLNYFKIKKSREFKKKGVVYTCITGGYDRPVIHKYFDINWDYVFFTDDKKLAQKKYIGMWKIIHIKDRMKLENHYLNRWYKMNPHKLFNEYEYSIYIDGNIRILNNKFFKDINKQINNKNIFSGPLHPFRNCLYDEAKRCIELKLDKKEKIERAIEKYKKEKFPRKFGLYEANILFRKHSDKKVIKLMEDWWEMINNYSRRDQLSLTYCIWKNNIGFNPLADKPYRDNRIKVLNHGGKKIIFN